jgi:hypothetical protein
MVWELGALESFDVEFLNKQGEWVQRWETAKVFQWPVAVRITTRDDAGERVWKFPLFVGQPAT